MPGRKLRWRLLYKRLSRGDELQDESFSIQNQKAHAGGLFLRPRAAIVFSIHQAFFALYSSPQFHIASKTGFKLCPNSVNVYSTRGGTSGKTVRISKPLSSICRSWEVSTFWLTLPMDFFNSPNRFVPDSKSRIMSTFHLSLMSVSVVSTGQAGKAFASLIVSSCLLVSKMLYSIILLYLPCWGQGARKIFSSVLKPEPLKPHNRFLSVTV